METGRQTHTKQRCTGLPPAATIGRHGDPGCAAARSINLQSMKPQVMLLGPGGCSKREGNPYSEAR